MFSGISKALDKLLFCTKISRNAGTLLRLLWNTKKFKWGKNNQVAVLKQRDAEFYSFSLFNRDVSVCLRTYEGDIDIFYEVFWQKVYAIPGRLFSEMKLIVDLGANIGMSALYFSLRAPGARIICVEPEPENYRLLEKNLVKQFDEKRITAIPVAVLDKDGEVVLMTSPLRYNSHVSGVDENGNKVKAICMSTLFIDCGIEHIDLLKIDIEGSEKMIFSGDISWLDKVSNILIELHSAADREIVLPALASKHFVARPMGASGLKENIYWATRA